MNIFYWSMDFIYRPIIFSVLYLHPIDVAGNGWIPKYIFLFSDNQWIIAIVLLGHFFSPKTDLLLE
nr:hypothetical protein [uncultured Bacteroides sp.]